MDGLERVALASRWVRGMQGVSVIRGSLVPVLVSNVVEHLSPRGVRVYFGPDELGMYMLILESDDAAWARQTWALVVRGETDGMTVPLPPVDGIFVEGLREATVR